MRELNNIMKEKGFDNKKMGEILGVSKNTFAYMKSKGQMSADRYNAIKEKLGEDFYIDGLPVMFSGKPGKRKKDESVIKLRNKLQRTEPVEAVDPEAEAIAFILEHIRETGRTVVPRYFLGKEERMVELLKDHGLETYYQDSERGGLVWMKEKVTQPTLNTKYLQTPEPEQTKCEIVEHKEKVCEHKEKVCERDSLTDSVSTVIDNILKSLEIKLKGMDPLAALEFMAANGLLIR